LKISGTRLVRMPENVTNISTRSTPDEPTKTDTKLDPIDFCESSNESNNICNTQWVQLYSTAAYFPLKPSETDRDVYHNYFTNFTDQCKDEKVGGCIERAMKVLPPRKDFDRNEMMMWICSLESLCRKEAGLPAIQCRSTKLMKRWGYEDGYL
jgi:hypothetical protein